MLEEELKSKKLASEMNELYEGYKKCRDNGKYFELNTCVGKVVFEKIPYNIKTMGAGYEYLSNLLVEGGVSICIYPKEEKAYDKIKRLEDENCRLRHTLLVISGNDSTSSTEMLGKIARDALYFRDTKTESYVIKK